MVPPQAYNKMAKTGADSKRTCADKGLATEFTPHDKWLCGSPNILASVKQGLADSAAGRVSKRESYAEHANDILED
jgi:hypothetical protein